MYTSQLSHHSAATSTRNTILVYLIFCQSHIFQSWQHPQISIALIPEQSHLSCYSHCDLSGYPIPRTINPHASFLNTSLQPISGVSYPNIIPSTSLIYTLTSYPFASIFFFYIETHRLAIRFKSVPQARVHVNKCRKKLQMLVIHQR